MSTSEPVAGAATALDGIDRLEGLSAAQAGLPDPAEVARWANAFFQEAPLIAQAVVAAKSAVNAAQPATAAAAAGTAPGVAGVSLPGIRVPGEAAIRQTAASGLAAAAAPGGGLAVPGSPGIPGGFSPAQIPAVPEYGFLSDARALLAQVPAIPVEAPGGAAIAAPLPPAATPVSPVLPATAGAVIPTPRPDSFGFLDAATPITAFAAVPVLEAVVPAAAIPAAPSAAAAPFDVQAVRRDFPILSEQVDGRQLVWLDNAATTQKPQAVIDRLAWFYQHENSNIHRAAHTLAARSTDAYEGAREKTRRFLNASDAKEIIFVRGATEGINLVAQSWGRRNLGKDDEIVVTHLEHHANIVPWQMLCAEKGARLRVAPVDDSGQILLDEYQKLIGPRTRLVALAQVSNALGTVTPVAEMTAIAHRYGARVLVDGAQAVSHLRVDVQAYDCDFYVFSGHKVFAPTGIGVVYGKSEALDATPPWQGGGNMIADVTFEKTLYQPPPWRFEAGTGNIADAVGLGAAIDYVERLGMHNIARYEHDLLVYGTEALRRIPGLRLIGTASEKASVLSFVLDGFTTQQVGEHLSREGIAVRSGHHCAQPILRRFGVESTVRPSLAFYNTCEEIDALVAAIWNLKSGRRAGPL